MAVSQSLLVLDEELCDALPGTKPAERMLSG
jgi:hypothetical protein